MMIGEVNMIATLGPIGAGPSPQDAEAVAAGASFSALLDEAAAAGHEMPEAVAGKNAGIGRIAAPVFIAEWCFAGSDAAAAQPDKAASAAVGENADAEVADQDEDAGEAVLDGVLNIDWLLAQPKRMNADVRVADADAAGKVNDSGQAAAGQSEAALIESSAPKATNIRMRAESKTDAGNVSVPEIATVDSHLERNAATKPAIGIPDMPAAVPAPAQTSKPEAVGQPVVSATSAALPNVKAQRFANAVETAAATPVAHPDATAPRVANAGEAAAATPAAQPDVRSQRAANAVATAAVAVPVPVVAETVPANVTAAAQVAALTTDVERANGDSPRPSSASSRLARAIEQIGGGGFEAVGQAASSAQGDSAANENATFSSSQQESAGAHAATPRTTSAPAFTVHVTPELTKAAEIMSRAVEAPLPSNPQMPDSGTVHQLVQTMRLQFRDGIGDAVVRLRPEHLGEVSISLRVDRQSVSATVHAEQPAVRQWLESQEASLRDGLAEQGLHLEKFVVRKDPEEQRQQSDTQEEARRRNRQARRQRQNEAEPRFEITV